MLYNKTVAVDGTDSLCREIHKPTPMITISGVILPSERIFTFPAGTTVEEGSVIVTESISGDDTLVVTVVVGIKNHLGLTVEKEAHCKER